MNYVNWNISNWDDDDDNEQVKSSDNDRDFVWEDMLSYRGQENSHCYPFNTPSN